LENNRMSVTLNTLLQAIVEPLLLIKNIVTLILLLITSMALEWPILEPTMIIVLSNSHGAMEAV